MKSRHALLLVAVLLAGCSVALPQSVNFSDLPKDLAIVRSEGNGKRVFAVFEDPFCPACKYFESQLDSLTDYTLYIYTYPILGRRSVETSTAVWCSSDPLSAWEKAVNNRTPLPADSKCLDKVGRILEAGLRFQINSTPSLIFENSTAIAGAVPAKYLSAMLNKAAGGTSTTNAAKEEHSESSAVAGPTLIEIPGGGPMATARPKAPAVFLFTNGDKIESDDYMLTKDDLFITTAGQKKRYPISALNQTATKTANVERGIVITFPKSSSEINLNF